MVTIALTDHRGTEQPPMLRGLLQEVVMSNLPAQAEQPEACCPGLRAAGFSIPPRMELPETLWAACFDYPSCGTVAVYTSEYSNV